MNCLIIASGTFGTQLPLEELFGAADLIVAADGGADHLKGIGRVPHTIIGDLDSISPDSLAWFREKRVEFKQFPARKDSTDTDLCVEYVLEKGGSHITLLGATGTRLDHTLANILMLRRLADKGINARILDRHNEIYLVKDRLELEGKPGDLLSIIPVSNDATGVCLEGLEYPLANQTLPMGTSLGISNCFKENRAFITVENGTLIVTKSRD